MGEASRTSVVPSTPRPLLAVFFATFFVRFAFGLTLAVFASYLTGKPSDLSAGDVGVAGAVSALAPVGEGATVLLSGIAADRFGRFPVLYFGMAVGAALFVAIGTTRDPFALGAANFVFGVASGAILASSLALVAQFSGAGERGLEMGRFDAMNLFGWVAGFAVGLAVEGSVPIGQLRFVFLVGTVALLAGLLAAGALMRREPRRASEPRAPIAAVLRQAVRVPVLVVTLPWFVIYALIGTALVFFGTSANALGLPSWELAVGIAAGGSVLVLTQPYFGRLADRRGRTRMMSVGAAGFVLTMLCASLLVAYGPRWPLLAATGVAAVTALAYGPAALAALADLAREISRATTMALYSLTISFGMFVGLLASTGLVALFGFSGLYVYFGGLASALALLTGIRWREAARATIPVR